MSYLFSVDYKLTSQSLFEMQLKGSVVRYPRYLDTYRRYLRDDTSIAKVTIYRGIS